MNHYNPETPPEIVELTITIPFYKNLVFLQRLLNSIDHSVSNSFLKGKVELVIVIDSMNNSEQEIHQLLSNQCQQVNFVRFLVHKNELNLGVAASRNVGIAKSQGRFLHFIDQDDEIDDNFYKLLTPHWHNSDFILTNGVFLDADGLVNRKIFYFKPKLTLKNMLLDNFIRSPGQVLIRRTVIGSLTFPLSEVHKGCDDRYFWILIFQLNRNMRCAYLNEPVYKAYLHEQNFSNDGNQLFLCSLEMWEKLKHLEFGDHKRFIEQNIKVLKYMTGQKRDLNTLLAFIPFQLQINKIVRKLVGMATAYRHKLLKTKHP